MIQFYIIVSAKNMDDLEILVDNKILKEDYKPIGGVAVIAGSMGAMFYQAMLKEV